MKKVYSLTMILSLIPLALGGLSPKASADDTIIVRDSDGGQYVEFNVNDSTPEGDIYRSPNGVTLRKDSLYTEDLIDNGKKWKYGVNFFLDNNYGTNIYVKARVKEHTNVTGALVSGNFTVPNGSSQTMGSFIASVTLKAWSVEVEYAWCSVNAPPKNCPDYYNF